MVLEATMIVVDNSETSRNGDYLPTRFEAQADAVNLIFTAKTDMNPESSVGLLSMGGWSGPNVLTTLTTDLGKILHGMHRTRIMGVPHLLTAINVAALALKHRQNKSQRQRIIVFNCSEITEDEETLVRLAKKMKKGNICVDIIAFGELSDSNVKKLEAFNEAIQGGDGSHLAIIPPGSSLLSDSIVSTPILAGTGASTSGSGIRDDGGLEGDMSLFEFGVDPSLDPELAMALRMSYEEEKARQEREKKEKAASVKVEETIKEEDEGESSGRAVATATSSTESNSKKEDNKDSKGNEQTEVENPDAMETD